MFTAAGFVVEQISGMPLKDFMKARIFEPLGMNDTTVTIAGIRDSANHATPYKKYLGQVVPTTWLTFDGMPGAGGVNSTVKDMAPWVAVQMNGGAYKGTRIISEKTLAEIHRPRVVVPPMGKEYYNPAQPLTAYAFGWDVSPYRGHLCLNHSGGTDGFASYLTFLPDEKLGMMLFINRENCPFHFAMAAQLYDHALGVTETQDWPAFYFARQAKMQQETLDASAKIVKARDSAAQPTHALDAFVGVYNHPGYGDMTVALRDGALRLLYNGCDFALTHNNRDTFEFVFEQTDPVSIMTLTFRTDRYGAVDGLETPSFEPALDTPMVFGRVKAEEK
jgi:CubicO group peptidase (beta-lactamase class C family)